MFTRKQIEEIAAKLADLSVKDSQFSNASIINGSEKVPILQNDQNRLISFGHLVSLIRESEDTSSLPCKLTVKCNTANSVIRINGVIRTTYNGHYGEMLDVQVSASGYVTWFGVISLIDTHTITVPLTAVGEGGSGGGGGSDSGGSCPCGDKCVCWKDYDDDDEGGGGGDVDPSQTYTVRVLNPSGGASLIINNDPSKNVFDRSYEFAGGSRVVINVTKPGYIPYSNVIRSINQNYVINVDDFLEEIDTQETKILTFTNPHIVFEAEGDLNAQTQVSTNSYISWEIRGENLPDYSNPSSEEAAENPAFSVNPLNINLVTGDSTTITVKQ